MIYKPVIDYYYNNMKNKLKNNEKMYINIPENFTLIDDDHIINDYIYYLFCENKTNSYIYYNNNNKYYYVVYDIIKINKQIDENNVMI